MPGRRFFSQHAYHIASLSFSDLTFVKVRFRYETPRADSAEWSSAIDKCFESIDLPMVGKDRSEYDRNISELLVDEKSLEGSRCGESAAYI